MGKTWIVTLESTAFIRNEVLSLMGIRHEYSRGALNPFANFF